jgi:hypothetical protein
MYAKSFFGLFLLIFAVSFFVLPATVLAQTNSLTLDKNHFAPGEPIQVHFTASSDFPASAWVGIIPSDVPHGSEVTNDAHDIAYYHLNNQTSGTLTFTAPAQPGAYDLRMNDTDDIAQNGHEVASVSFTVS